MFKKMGITDDKQESLQSTYWFSSSKGLPSLQLTDPTSVLDYLKPYGIDAKWIQEKADYMLLVPISLVLRADTSFLIEFRVTYRKSTLEGVK